MSSLNKKNITVNSIKAKSISADTYHGSTNVARSILISSTTTPHTALDNSYQFIQFSGSGGDAISIQGIQHIEANKGGQDHLVFYINNSGAGTNTTIVNNQAGLPSGSYPIIVGGQSLFFDGSASSDTHSLIVELIWNNNQQFWLITSTRLRKIPVVRVSNNVAPPGQTLGIATFEPVEFNTVDQTIGNFGTGGNALTVPMTGIYNFKMQIVATITAAETDTVEIELRRNGVAIGLLNTLVTKLGPVGNGPTPLVLAQDGLKLLKDDVITLQVQSATGNTTIPSALLSMSWQDFDGDGLFP